MRYIAGREHHLDDKQTTIGADYLATMTKDSKALFLTPIVDDMRQQVSVAACGHGLKKIAGLNGNAFINAVRSEGRVSITHHVRQIEQHAVRSAMLGQYRCKQVAGSPADINDILEYRKIVSARYGRRLIAVKADHSLAEKARRASSGR